jgi:hypothetical protein
MINNHDMIDNATKALSHYRALVQRSHRFHSMDTDVRDLLTDLMHLCDAKYINFDDELVMARANHRREVMHDLV